MNSNPKEKPGFLKSLARLQKYKEEIGLKWIYFLTPAVLSLLAAFFEAVSLSLLIPVAKGIMESNFNFVHTTRYLNALEKVFPGLLEQSKATIFIILLAIIFIAAGFKNIFGYASLLTVEHQIAKIATGMRKLIFGRYLIFGKLFFDKNSMGHLNQILVGFTDDITRKLQDVNTLIFNVFLLAAYLATLLIISWKLTVISFLIFPVLYWSLMWIVSKIERTSRDESEAKLELNKKIANILLCIPLVKAYTREDREEKEFNRISDAQSSFQFSIGKKREFVRPLQEMIALAATLLLVSVMALLLIRERSGDVAAFLVYFVLLRRAMIAFTSINAGRATLASVADPIARVCSILDDKDKYIFRGGRTKFLGLKEKIEICHLSFSYGVVPVLKDVSFSIEKGKMTAIVGPTGAGKSTIIHLLMRFYDCEPGSIKMDGVDIREFDLASLRSHTAIVSQDTLLFNNTIRENILYGLEREISEEELIEVCKKAQLYDFIQSQPHKLDTLIGDRGILLSGGEKQRVSIARAMLKKAEILLLDEATSALDSHTEKMIQEAIQVAISGRTSLVIAHRLSTIRKADSIVVLENGNVAEKGTLQKLLEKKGKFYSYWHEQNEFRFILAPKS